MLIRIVRMTFHQGNVSDFLNLFEKSKGKIRAFPGCTHLELHEDYDSPNIFSTYSIWESQEDLNNYRESGLFKAVWSDTKMLFSAPPIAFSNQLKVGPVNPVTQS